MEQVDIYNEQGEKLGYTKERRELAPGEYRLSCYVWIMNDQHEILVVKRVASAKKCANMWTTVSGGARKGENYIQCALHKLEEEIGIILEKKELRFIGSFARWNDYVQVFLAPVNIDIYDIVLEEEEIQDAKWVSVQEYARMVKDGSAVKTSFPMFLDYYQNYYEKHLEMIDGELTMMED